MCYTPRRGGITYTHTTFSHATVFVLSSGLSTLTISPWVSQFQGFPHNLTAKWLYSAVSHHLIVWSRMHVIVQTALSQPCLMMQEHVYWTYCYPVPVCEVCKLNVCSLLTQYCQVLRVKNFWRRKVCRFPKKPQITKLYSPQTFSAIQYIKQIWQLH